METNSSTQNVFVQNKITNTNKEDKNNQQRERERERERERRSHKKADRLLIRVNQKKKTDINHLLLLVFFVNISSFIP